jgi:hypothetical protein
MSFGANVRRYGGLPMEGFDIPGKERADAQYYNAALAK